MDQQAYIKKIFPILGVLAGVIGVAVIVAVISPRYAHQSHEAEEAQLRQELGDVRTALVKYRADNGKYPDALDDLVKRKYLASIPADPLTRSSTTWVLVEGPSAQGISDIKSGASGEARDGTPYRDW